MEETILNNMFFRNIFISWNYTRKWKPSIKGLSILFLHCRAKDQTPSFVEIFLAVATHPTAGKFADVTEQLFIWDLGYTIIFKY